MKCTAKDFFYFFFACVDSQKQQKSRHDFFCSTQGFYLLIFSVAADFGIVHKANVIYKPGGQKGRRTGRRRCSLYVYNPAHSQISNYEIMGTNFIF